MKRIQWKVILVCLVVVFIPILLLNEYTVKFFDSYTRVDLESHMRNSGLLIGEYYKRSLDGESVLDDASRNDVHRVLAAYAAEIDSHIQILSTNGVVLVDSDLESVSFLDLSARPEVKEALAGRYSARSLLKDDGRRMYYYTARAIKDEGGAVVGVAYVYRHTAPIVNAIRQMITHQRMVTVVALIVAATLATLLAYTLSSRLRRLTQGATAFAKGDARLDVVIGGQDEIAELGEAVHAMATELARRNRYNKEFISTVMHELKMPLTAIKGAAELLEQGAAEKVESRQKFVGNIRQEADRMIRMVWELNELTKLDVENLRGNKVEVEYGSFLREMVDRILPSLDADLARVECHAPDEPLSVLVIPGRIEQVVSNLLDNAFRYTPSSGVVSIEVSVSDDGFVLTTVRDTGPGVSLSNAEKIFDRFFTTEPKGQPKDYGSGLGLAIARSIIDNHLGRIWLDSASDGGASFTFSLPLNQG